MSYRVGVDVGGTFTDIVVFGNGDFRVIKVLTRIDDITGAIIEALQENGINLGSVDAIIHATTLGTNMLLGQEKLVKPKIALITTKGFRDVIEIGRQIRPELYNLFFERPKPLIDRRDRFEVDERVDADGRVLKSVDINELKRISKVLLERGYVGVVIAFINSHINPTNEVKAKEVLSSLNDGIDITLSSEVIPIEGEYERFSTTILNALLRPILSQYLSDFRGKLSDAGFNGDIYVMQSSGGISSLDLAIKTPVLFIESGPAAGAVAAAYYSRIVGDCDVASFDMGGTTAKAATIIDNEPLVTMDYEVGGKMHYGRLVKGSGYPVKLPYIDLVEVSAGGGTIAWIDEGGALRVGPISAGSSPGPACYGLGGDRPTVTDANFVLGRLGEFLAGGEVRLNKKLALDAISKLSDALGMDVIETAYGIIKIVNSVMSKAIRIVTLERGVDVKSLKLYAFGGAGPLHAVELIEDIGIDEALIPRHPGTFSALGLLLSDHKFEKTKSVLKDIDKLSNEDINVEFEELEKKVFDEVKFDRDKCVLLKYVGLRYRGQLEEIKVLWRGSLKSSLQEFYSRYKEKYGFVSYDEIVEVSTISITVIYGVEKPSIKKMNEKPYDAKPDSYREVFFTDSWFKTGIYSREKLRPGARIYGPAVIEEYDSTILIPPNYFAYVDGYLNIRIKLC